MNEAETIDLILSLPRQMNKAGDDGCPNFSAG